MLEALLAWVEQGLDSEFGEKAREIVALANAHFLDQSTGAVAEFFGLDWNFVADDAGSIREPGHQFEWAYLLYQAERLLGGDHSVACKRLYDFASHYGVLEGRVLCSLGPAGNPIDMSSRLWAQTERLRTVVMRLSAARSHASGAAVTEFMESFYCVKQFLDQHSRRGLWHDRIAPDGSWVEEPVPASSLYHILTGLDPLLSL